MNRFEKYSRPTVEMLLSLLEEAFNDELEVDKILEKLSEDIIEELVRELHFLEKNGKIDLSKKINLDNSPALLQTVKTIEQAHWDKIMENAWLMMMVVTESLERTYQQTLIQTYDLFRPTLPYAPGPNSLELKVQITDTNIKSNVLQVPWCQDGKTYSARLYNNVANFQSKLNYVLEQGIREGKGLDWMTQAWRKLTGSTAYDTARLLKTETVAMWSRATKEAYLTMGIEYVEITGDAACGAVCTDYVGEVIPLREAELGDQLPPYHPNCACDFIAYEEMVDGSEALEEEED